MTKTQIKLLTVILLLFAAKISNAQWDTKLGFGASYYTGNVDKFDLRADGEITRKDTIIESKLFGKIIYSEVDEVRKNEEYSGGLQFDYKPKNKLTPFIMVSLYKNQFKKIDMRFNGLAGAKWIMHRGLDSLKKVHSEYSISAAVLFDYTKSTKQYNEENIEITPDDKKRVRLSIRPKIKQRLSENVYLQHVTFYQPNLEDFGDYTIDSETTIATKLNKRIDLGLAYEYHFMSKPLSEGVEKADQVFLAKLTIKF